MRRLFPFAAALCALLLSCATAEGTLVRSEEYFSLGTAYFELGKYAEAEKWFSLALKAEKTRAASEYQLGRIAFLKGDPEGAAARFERLLEKDPANVLVLRSAAYSWMKAEKWDRALALFDRLEALLPETEDARYNYALALASAGREEAAAEKLQPYVERKPDDRAALLLLARTERRLKRPEAAARYEAALALKDEEAVRLELAEVYEEQRFYARALELYRKSSASGADKAALRFRTGRLMLLAGEDAAGGLAELRAALKDGFKDAEKLSGLSRDERLSEELRAAVAGIIGEAADSLAPPAPQEP